MPKEEIFLQPEENLSRHNRDVGKDDMKYFKKRNRQKIQASNFRIKHGGSKSKRNTKRTLMNKKVKKMKRDKRKENRRTQRVKTKRKMKNEDQMVKERKKQKNKVGNLQQKNDKQEDSCGDAYVKYSCLEVT